MPLSDYTDIVLSARGRSIARGRAELRLGLARIYVEEMGRALEGVAQGEMSEAEARAVVRDLADALARYAEQGEALVKRRILQMMQDATEAHSAALRRVGEEFGVSLEASFSGVPTRAYEAMYLRRDMGLTKSYKTLSRYNAEQYAGRIEGALDGMLLRGESPQTATRRIAAALAKGDPAAEAAFRQYGVGGWLREYRRFDPDNEALAIANRLRADAERIARTEPNAAFHEADRLAAIESPVVRAMRWNLSPRHPKWDICDIYAKTDLYGLGRGVMPAEVVVVVPHPNCLCFRTFELVDPREATAHTDRPPKPREIGRRDIGRILTGDVSSGEVQRAIQQANRDTSKAYEYYQKSEEVAV